MTATRRRQIAREQAGLCTYCPAQATHGRLCERCRSRKRAYWRRWAAKNPRPWHDRRTAKERDRRKMVRRIFEAAGVKL